MRSPLGEHQCIGGEAHGGGSTALLAIRPEFVQIATEPLPGGDGFEATLTGRYFLGPYNEYFLKVADTELRAQSRLTLDAELGQRVYARVAPEHCRIVAGSRSADDE